MHFGKPANTPVGEELDAVYGQRVAEGLELEVGPGALETADGNGCGALVGLVWRCRGRGGEGYRVR